MKAAVLAALALVVAPHLCAQATRAKPRAATDQLGMTCVQILGRPSVEWVAAFQQESKGAGSEPEKAVRAITVYGKCYDARTDRLAASLGGRGARALGASGNFRDFEKALENFEAKALAVNDPPADAVKTAYASLYEKQFRYMLYEGLGKPATKLGGATASAPADSARSAAAGRAAAVASQKATTPAADDTDPLTEVKNHFGEQLNALPEDKMHELHSAFGDILSRGEMSASTRLAVYRYAIFLLEPSSDQPFSPPPF